MRTPISALCYCWHCHSNFVVSVSSIILGLHGIRRSQKQFTRTCTRTAFDGDLVKVWGTFPRSDKNQYQVHFLRGGMSRNLWNSFLKRLTISIFWGIRRQDWQGKKSHVFAKILCVILFYCVNVIPAEVVVDVAWTKIKDQQTQVPHQNFWFKHSYDVCGT